MPATSVSINLAIGHPKGRAPSALTVADEFYEMNYNRCFTLATTFRHAS